MKLSIIVPVYNMAGDGKLNYCMDSLLNQTVQDAEIIAVDDASTDDSLAILKGYEDKNPGKVRVIASPVNKRQGGAKNLGIRASSGEWLGFMDSDDWAAPDMYEKLLGKAEETGADVVGCDYNLVQEHTMQVGRVVQNNEDSQTGILEESHYRSLIMRSGSMVIKIYRRSMVVDNELWFPENIFYEDNYAGPLWMMHCKHFEKVNEPLYYYYQHEDSTVHYISEDKCRDRMTAAVLFLEACKKNGWLERYHREIEYRFTEIYFVNTLFSYMQGRQPKHLAFLKGLSEGMKKHFPDFRQNPYYEAKVTVEEKKLIRFMMKSDWFFLCYYKLLHGYRETRKRLAGTGVLPVSRGS